MCNLEFEDQQHFLLHCTSLITHLSYTSTIGQLRYSNTTQIISYDSAVKLLYLLQPTELILKTVKGSYSKSYSYMQACHFTALSLTSFYLTSCSASPLLPINLLYSPSSHAHAIHTQLCTHIRITVYKLLTAEWLPWLHGLLW